MGKKNKKQGLNFPSAKAPRKQEKITLWIMIMCSFGWMAIFLWWFWNDAHMSNPWLYWPLTIALLLKLLRMAYEWYNYMNIGVPHKPESKPLLSVDMLTTACPGEPHWMIIRTLKKMVAVKYPHTTYLCDEGNDPALKKVCDELGVVHVTRVEKKNAKAGNINNALKWAKGDLCIIMDPDHEPVPEFIDRVLPYFEDPNVGYVQCVQGYYNQRESFVARAAAEQTYHFYGPMMMCMHSYGTPQAIGANCTFRRTALDEIGGHAAGLTEDMHTSMRLQSKGWKCLYIPEMLSKGLVPADVSAWYKQQIKWGRGTFELFFEVLPFLLKGMTWRQRFHHLMSPVYYLSGVVNLINILIPILALLLGEYPWTVNIETFALFYTPLLMMTILIRQYSQRWLMEETERGFHIRGGLLQLGTWWVYVVSLIYSIARVKVPYIPTPKEGEVKNNWKVVAPNLVAAGISITAVAYGLHYDYNPYSIFMALFAGVNATFLTYFSLIVQQKLMLDIKVALYKLTGLQTSYIWYVRFWKLRHAFYFGLRKSALALSLVFICTLLGYNFKSDLPPFQTEHMIQEKHWGGFYKGLYLPQNDTRISWSAIQDWEKASGTQVNLVSFYQAWGPQSLVDFPDSALNSAIAQKGIVPMITWEPWSSTFPEFKDDTILGKDRMVMYYITTGTFDDYLDAYCQKIKSIKGPVFLRFAHEPDNLQYPWSTSGWNKPEEFREAHRYIVNFFSSRGVSNVAWVWNPWDVQYAEVYYPGDDFVDWIGITGLNYGTAAKDRKWRTISDIYEPFRKKLLKHHKPVMFSEFGSTAYGGDQSHWHQEALKTIEKKYPEVKSITFFYSHKDKNWATPWRPSRKTQFIDWTFQNSKVSFAHLNTSYQNERFSACTSYRDDFEVGEALPSCKAIHKTATGFELLYKGKPFYIKGIAYNTGHDWQDGNIPLTKNYLKHDFERIKAMGANTIRRYSSSVYDKNIMDAANHHNLKVIYGFWLDPKVDYSTDSAQMHAYLKDITDKVMEFKDDSAILAWNIGNETWGLLKHSYGQPYLTKVRKHYILFLEQVASTIKRIDPEHPIFSAMEHTKELPYELSQLHDYAPTVDMAGINSYYIEHIRILDSVTGVYYPNKPYIVSEFGPKGYWNPYLSKLKHDSVLVEESDEAKGHYYAKQWNSFIAPHAGHNMGGVAFCWHDRFEGTATWFGLSDYKSRLKPTYYYLKEAWTGIHTSPKTPTFNIQWENDSIVPGKYAAFKVNLLENPQEKYTYEWVLRSGKSHMTAYPGYIRVFNEGKRIFMKVPEKPGQYRLYLYVSDQEGNVSCISHDLQVAYQNKK